LAISEGDSEATSRKLYEWLKGVSDLATLLFGIVSLFLEDKAAKQIAFSLALIIPVASAWYRRLRFPQPKVPAPEGSDSTTAADRLLKGYLALFKEDRETRVPINRLRWIRNFASAELLKRQNAKELLRVSEIAFYWSFGSNLIVGLFLVSTLYAFLTTNYAFNPINYAFGRGNIMEENPSIKLQKGAGTMVFGSDTPDLQTGEQALNPAMPIGDYSMQKTEVTNQQFRICRQAGGCKQDPIPSPDSPRYYEDSTYDDYPVVGITAFQAREFCMWLGGDLPTTEQWERAARGLNGRPWPWLSSDLTPDRANLYTPDGPGGLTKASDYPLGASPEGILNLVGNVWEWTRTVLFTQDEGATFTLENWNGVDTQVTIAVRGGSWGYQMGRITETQFNLPGDFSEYIGFRCVTAE